MKWLAQVLILLPGAIPGEAKEEDNQDDENPPEPPPAEGLTLGRSWHDFYTSLPENFQGLRELVRLRLGFNPGRIPPETEADDEQNQDEEDEEGKAPTTVNRKPETHNLASFL
ncbi:MAG: hypothetical protein ACUVSK_07160 [Desulfotomaculales bacterium]